jgi:hypothetical protein
MNEISMATSWEMMPSLGEEHLEIKEELLHKKIQDSGVVTPQHARSNNRMGT